MKKVICRKCLRKMRIQCDGSFYCPFCGTHYDPSKISIGPENAYDNRQFNLFQARKNND